MHGFFFLGFRLQSVQHDDGRAPPPKRDNGRVAVATVAVLGRRRDADGHVTAGRRAAAAETQLRRGVPDGAGRPEQAEATAGTERVTSCRAVCVHQGVVAGCGDRCVAAIVVAGHAAARVWLQPRRKSQPTAAYTVPALATVAVSAVATFAVSAFAIVADSVVATVTSPTDATVASSPVANVTGSAVANVADSTFTDVAGTTATAHSYHRAALHVAVSDGLPDAGRVHDDAAAAAASGRVQGRGRATVLGRDRGTATAAPPIWARSRGRVARHVIARVHCGRGAHAALAERVRQVQRQLPHDF